MTGNPAIKPGTVNRPFVNLYSPLSIGYIVRWKTQAPGPLAATFWVTRWIAFAAFTS
jgi:hypothetical protein